MRSHTFNGNKQAGIRDRLLWLLNRSHTSATRAWFSAMSFGFAVYLIGASADSLAASEYRFALYVMPAWAWGLVFLINSLALAYGVITQEFDGVLFGLEGVLGCLAWSAMGLSSLFNSLIPNAVTAATLISWWLMYRYPTEEERLE